MKSIYKINMKVVISMTKKAYEEALRAGIPKKYIEYNQGAINDVSITIECEKAKVSMALEGPFEQDHSKKEGRLRWTSPFAMIEVERIKDKSIAWRIEPMQNGKPKWGAASTLILPEKPSYALWYALDFAR